MKNYKKEYKDKNKKIYKKIDKYTKNIKENDIKVSNEKTNNNIIKENIKQKEKYILRQIQIFATSLCLTVGTYIVGFNICKKVFVDKQYYSKKITYDEQKDEISTTEGYYFKADNIKITEYEPWKKFNDTNIRYYSEKEIDNEQNKDLYYFIDFDTSSSFSRSYSETKKNLDENDMYDKPYKTISKYEIIDENDYIEKPSEIMMVLSAIMLFAICGMIAVINELRLYGKIDELSYIDTIKKIRKTTKEIKILKEKLEKSQTTINKLNNETEMHFEEIKKLYQELENIYLKYNELTLKEQKMDKVKILKKEN